DVPLWMVLLVWSVGGFLSGLINPLLSAIIFERLPRTMVGRGMAMTGALTRLGVPLGAPVLGAQVGVVGTVPVRVGPAAVDRDSVLSPLHKRVRHRLRRPEEPPTTSADDQEKL